VQPFRLKKSEIIQLFPETNQSTFQTQAGTQTTFGTVWTASQTLTRQTLAKVQLKQWSTGAVWGKPRRQSGRIMKKYGVENRFSRLINPHWYFIKYSGSNVAWHRQ